MLVGYDSLARKYLDTSRLLRHHDTLMVQGEEWVTCGKLSLSTKVTNLLLLITLCYILFVSKTMFKKTFINYSFHAHPAYLDISSVRNFEFGLKVRKHLGRLSRNGPWRRGWTVHWAVNWLAWNSWDNDRNAQPLNPIILLNDFQ